VHLLLTDETNAVPSDKARFFVYGGLVIDFGVLAQLDDLVATTRVKFGYRPGDLLKFDTNARPGQVSLEAATAAKNEVIQACIEVGCKFIAYVVLHAIARSRRADEIVAWGANCVIGKFNYFLHSVGSYGVVAMDRFPAGRDYSFLTDKFCYGLTFQGEDPVTLDRIKLFSSTCINASHASSAMDITLGAFRYCINQPENVEAAKVMMANICRLIWCTRDGDNLMPLERGLIFRPKEVAVDKYKAEYDGLLRGINDLIADASL
jgi:hypothetical protein